MKPKNHVWLGLALVWGMLCPFIVSAEANLATPLYLPTADEQIEISVVRSDAKGGDKLFDPEGSTAQLVQYWEANL